MNRPLPGSVSLDGLAKRPAVDGGAQAAQLVLASALLQFSPGLAVPGPRKVAWGSVCVRVTLCLFSQVGGAAAAMREPRAMRVCVSHSPLWLRVCLATFFLWSKPPSVTASSAFIGFRRGCAKSFERKSGQEMGRRHQHLLATRHIQQRRQPPHERHDLAYHGGRQLEMGCMESGFISRSLEQPARHTTPPSPPSPRQRQPNRQPHRPNNRYVCDS